METTESSLFKYLSKRGSFSSIDLNEDELRNARFIYDLMVRQRLVDALPDQTRDRLFYLLHSLVQKNPNLYPKTPSVFDASVYDRLVAHVADENNHLPLPENSFPAVPERPTISTKDHAHHLHNLYYFLKNNQLSLPLTQTEKYQLLTFMRSYLYSAVPQSIGPDTTPDDANIIHLCMLNNKAKVAVGKYVVFHSIPENTRRNPPLLVRNIFTAVANCQYGCHIPIINIYEINPERIPEYYLDNPKKEWYFYSLSDGKYKDESVMKLIVGDGYWKKLETDTSIVRNSKSLGYIRTFQFYQGNPSDWFMDQYRLTHPLPMQYGVPLDVKLDNWVFCKIYKKKDTANKVY